MAQKVFIPIPSQGTLQDLLAAITTGLQKLPPKERAQFKKALREGV